MNVRDLTGLETGQLTIGARAGSYLTDATWHATCRCGATLIVRSNHVLAGYVTTCGDVEKHPRQKRDVPGYNSAHRRLRRLRGSASAQQCVDGDDGHMARDWSYDGTDPDEIVYGPRSVRYSLDVERYVPRCRRHHVQHDIRERQAA